MTWRARKARRLAEIDEEITDHLARESRRIAIEDGCSTEEARRRAVERFGAVEEVRRACVTAQRLRRPWVLAACFAVGLTVVIVGGTLRWHRCAHHARGHEVTLVTAHTQE